MINFYSIRRKYKIYRCLEDLGLELNWRCLMLDLK
nr:MAG TPA: hypothetical protein [Caudoviricetes sp.]